MMPHTISIEFFVGFFIGQVVLFLLAIIILRRSFPKSKMRRPSFFVEKRQPSSSDKKDDSVGPFEKMSEFFLKIYKPSSGDGNRSPTRDKVVDLHQRRDDYRSLFVGFDDTMWINEVIQTAFFYYSTSESMHSSIKQSIEKSLFETAPSFLVGRFWLMLLL